MNNHNDLLKSALKQPGEDSKLATVATLAVSAVLIVGFVIWSMDIQLLQNITR